MNEPQGTTVAFNNGLTREQDDEIDEIHIELGRLKARIEALGRHRSYSTAITKLDEGQHWLRDRKHRGP